MTERYLFEAPQTTSGSFGCIIPATGVNAPRLVAVDGDLPVILRDPITDQRHFESFSCEVPELDAPATPDRVAPDVSLVREVHSEGTVTMPDGVPVEFWGFEDPTTDRGPRRPMPSPVMRVREGQIVHTTLISSKNNHTIHHHGIEPTPYNDGVGHTSFEVKDQYTYQWRASESGSYFYHCHKNTVLHFEMGMYGPLIVDPVEGEGHVHRGRETIAYDHEAIWIPDDVDPSWHDPDQDHDAGTDCEDGGFDVSQHLLRFEPRYWLLSGVPEHEARSDPRVAIRCRRGERVLVRLLNASYGPVRVQLPFDAEVVGRDGHALGTAREERYSYPYVVPAGAPLQISTAQRFDVLLVPDRIGTFTVPFDFRHWVRGGPYGRVETTITVT